MIHYYQTDDGYIAVTDESPAGFEGLIFVGRGGPLDNIQEQLFPVDQLTGPVNVNDVPPEWVRALGYHTVADFPLLDEEGENLVAEILVREPVREPVAAIVPSSPQVAEDGPDSNVQVGLLIGLMIIVYLFILR